MPYRTKLYQQPRSPLIQGRSRIERPVWESAFMGAGVSFGVWAAVLAGDVAGKLAIFVRDPAVELLDLVPGPAFALAVAAAVGGYLGAGLAMGMGWHKGWKTAALVALVFDFIALLIVV